LIKLRIKNVSVGSCKESYLVQHDKASQYQYYIVMGKYSY